jgi:hypothetical protein
LKISGGRESGIKKLQRRKNIKNNELDQRKKEAVMGREMELGSRKEIKNRRGRT